MTQAILHNQEAGDSVVKDSLTTAADGRNCRGAQYSHLTIRPLPILNTACREWHLPRKRWASGRFATRRVADSIVAAPKASAEKSSVVRDATNLRHMRGFYLAFPIRDALRRESGWMHLLLGDMVHAATVKESLSVQTKGESKVSDHFRGVTKMVDLGNNRRSRHDGR